jgi:hypothetical protein
MERETKTITTPTGKEAVIKSYFTAGERRQIRRVMFAVDGANKLDENQAEKIEDVMITTGVISFDGVSESLKILNLIIDGQCQDLDFILKELSAMLNLILPKNTDGTGANSSASEAAQ